MTELTWTLIGFLVGAIPFSVWLGRLVLRTDSAATVTGTRVEPT